MEIVARPDPDLSPFDENGLVSHGTSAPRTAQSTAESATAETVIERPSPRRSFQRNFLAITLSSVLAILLIFFTYLETSTYRNACDRIDQKIIRMVDGGSILLADATARKDTGELLLLLAPVLGDPDVVSVGVTLADGTRLAEHGEPLAGIPDKMVFRRAILHVVKDEPTRIGWVEVGITHRRIDQELASRLWTDVALAALILAAIVVSSYLSLRMTVMRPMRKLLSAIEGWEVDDDPKPVAHGRNDEFGQLIAAFNQMQRRQQYYQRSLLAARDTAESADRAKTAFLAIIGHELRTPLNAIIGFSDLIKQKMGDAEKQLYGTYLGHIHDSGNALLDMVNDILEITHAQAGKLIPDTEPVSLKAVIDQVVELCVKKADGDTATIRNNVPASSPQFRTDSTRLRRMLRHLITNAIRFTAVDGDIEIDASWSDDGVAIRIADTGCGIPEDRLSDIQLPFAQLSTDWEHHSEGAGLGLTYVRQMAELLGGSFVLESEVGKGTTTTVKLPPGAPI